MTTQLLSLANAGGTIAPRLVTFAAVILVVIGELNTSVTLQGRLPEQYATLRESPCWALADYLTTRCTSKTPVLVPAGSLCSPIVQVTHQNSFPVEEYSNLEALDAILSHYKDQSPVVMLLDHPISCGSEDDGAPHLPATDSNKIEGFNARILFNPIDQPSAIATKQMSRHS